MNTRRKLTDWIVMGACVFILSKAVLSFILDPEETPTEGNPTWRVILSISYVAVVLILIPWYRETLFVLRRNWSLVALVLLALVSAAWADMPGFVLRKTIGLYGATLLGIALVVRTSFDEQLRALSWLFRAIGVLSLACVFLLPGLSVTEEGQWMGVFEHKNAMGSMLGLSVLVEWQRPADSRIAKVLKILSFALYAVLLLHSDSVTPSIALCGAVLLVESYKFTTFKLRMPLYAYSVAVAVVLSIAVAVAFANSDVVMGVLGRSSNLTGRTEIWGLVVSFIPEKPILGYGYSGFWLGASPESYVINRIMRGWVFYSHNGYLEMLLNLGLVGLGMTFTVLAIGFRRAFDFSKQRQVATSLWPLAFLCYFTLHNLGECTFMIQDLEWSLCVACIAGSDRLLADFDLAEREDMPLIALEATR